MSRCQHEQPAGSTTTMTHCLGSPIGERSTCSCPYVSVCPAGYGACRASLICKLHLSFVAEGTIILSGSAPSLGGSLEKGWAVSSWSQCLWTCLAKGSREGQEVPFPRDTSSSSLGEISLLGRGAGCCDSAPRSISLCNGGQIPPASCCCCWSFLEGRLLHMHSHPAQGCLGWGQDPSVPV